MNTDLTEYQYPSFADQVNELTKPMNLKVIGQLNHGGTRGGSKARKVYPPVFTQVSPYSFNVNGDPTQQAWLFECSYDKNAAVAKLLSKCPLMGAHTLAAYEWIEAFMADVAKELNVDVNVHSEIKYGYGMSNDVIIKVDRRDTADEDLPRIFSHIIKVLDEVLEGIGYMSGDITRLKVVPKIINHVSARSNS